MKLRLLVKEASQRLATAFSSVAILAAVVATAAFPTLLAAELLSTTFAMSPERAALLAGACEALIATLIIKRWQKRLDNQLLTHSQGGRFPYFHASIIAIAASFMASFLGALVLLQAHVPNLLSLLALLGISLAAPETLAGAALITALVARIAAHTTLTLAQPRLMQWHEFGLRRQLTNREQTIQTEKALLEHRAFIHRTNLQAREIAAAHRATLAETYNHNGKEASHRNQAAAQPTQVRLNNVTDSTAPSPYAPTGAAFRRRL